jgi:hypothetical protein
MSITKHETTSSRTTKEKIERQKSQANLLPLPVEEAASKLDVSTRTVIRDRQELQLKALTNLSSETEQYWQLEMADIRADIEHVRQMALNMKERGGDLLLRAADRWIKLVEMNIVKKSITAHVDVSSDSRVERIKRACRGINDQGRWDNEIIPYLESLPRDPNPFPKVGRVLEGETK